MKAWHTSHPTIIGKTTCLRDEKNMSCIECNGKGWVRVNGDDREKCTCVIVCACCHTNLANKWICGLPWCCACAKRRHLAQ